MGAQGRCGERVVHTRVRESGVGEEERDVTGWQQQQRLDGASEHEQTGRGLIDSGRKAVREVTSWEWVWD